MTFSYGFFLEIEINDRIYEWNAEWTSPVQLQVGDMLDIGDGIAALRVRNVTWYTDSPGSAFVMFDDIRVTSVEHLPEWLVDETTSRHKTPDDSE